MEIYSVSAMIRPGNPPLPRLRKKPRQSEKSPRLHKKPLPDGTKKADPRKGTRFVSHG